MKRKMKPKKLSISLFESNIISLLDDLIVTINNNLEDNFSNIEITNDKTISVVRFQWESSDKVNYIVFEGLCKQNEKWHYNFTYINRIDSEKNFIVREQVPIYEIVRRLVQISGRICRYNVSVAKEHNNFYFSIDCTYSNQKPYISIYDTSKNKVGYVVLTDDRPETIDDLIIELQEKTTITKQQLWNYLNSYDSRYKIDKWTLAWIMWDISCINKSPENEVTFWFEGNCYDSF